MSTRQQSSSQRSSSYSSTKLTSLSHSIQATDVYMSLDDGRICKKSDHKKPKNCIDNVFCVHHIHKMDEGIWHTEQTRFMNQCIPVNRIAQHRHDMQRPVGLTNLGATCYLNVLMQTLFQTIPIRNAIYAMDAATCEGQGTSVVQSLQNTFSFMHTSEQLLFSLASFTGILTHIFIYHF
jgi:ubiquitin C-terminal hydrolase